MDERGCRTITILFLLCLVMAPLTGSAKNIPHDLSGVRGFNYTPASAQGHSGFWLHYDAAEVGRDLDNAKKLNLNQVRVFTPYDAWSADKVAFREHLGEFVRACHQRGMGVMPALAPGQKLIDESPITESHPLLKEWVADLIAGIGKEPGLAFWDVANEPDWRGYPEHRRPPNIIERRMELAKWMANTVHQLDRRTPVTIGCTHVACMKELASFVDVLSFHDYSPTRSEIVENIEAGKQFAAQVHKGIFNTEMGCLGRANPYDVTLQEYMKAGMGWYIWELMVTHYWGNVHGVFYADGSVRDPSIAAAILGFFRNRGPDVVLEEPDREGWVTRSVAEAKQWLADPNPDWNTGLRIAETEANLLESGQLIAMREPPTRTVDLLRAGKPDLSALQEAMRKFTQVLEPYQKK
jgi:hypothetical protein